MTDNLKTAIGRKFDYNLWPPRFIHGCALLAAKNRLDLDAVLLALICGTSIFAGKSQIILEGSDRVECGSLWILNIQVSIQSKQVRCVLNESVNVRKYLNMHEFITELAWVCMRALVRVCVRVCLTCVCLLL